MKTLRLASLTGTDNEHTEVIYEAMKTCSNRERLAVCLFLMSDLPESELSLAAIEENLRLIFPPTHDRGRSPEDYTDFQASAIRFLFNSETREVKAGTLSDDARLWRNVKPGCWRNTAVGDEYAREVLLKQGIKILKHKPFGTAADGMTQRLRDSEKRVEVLTRENAELLEQLDAQISLCDQISDPALKQRLSLLETAPLDTLMREAGVILEDRLRAVSGLDSSVHGVALVDAAMAPASGALVFSSHPGEQDGVRMLYRGAMQFIRNPPMHKLIQYPESTARLLLQMIDALLQLLSGDVHLQRGAVSVDDVRRMLARRRISPGQRALYEILYSAEEGLSKSELAERMGRSQEQLAGVLGALGRRINGTEGLEGKGGVGVVLDIWEGEDGDWYYRMRSDLRQALELEGVA